MNVIKNEALKKSLREDWHNPANLVSFGRLLTCPLLLVVLIIAITTADPTYWWWSFGLFVIVAASDKLDGWLARNYTGVTALGKALDPIADKFLVFLPLVALCFVHGRWLVIPVVIMIAREIHVTLWIKYRSYTQGEVRSAIQSGRIKMVLQSLAVAAFLVPIDTTVTVMAQWLLLAGAAVASLWSWWDYTRKE